MVFEIVWTLKAVESFGNIISYLEKNWTEKEIRKFITKTDRAIGLIGLHPYSFLRSEKKGIYKARIDKNNSLFFRIKIDQVEILIFWDGRRDIKILKKQLK